MLTTAIPDNGL